MKTNLTKKQMEIVAKYEPKTAKGKGEGSFYGNKKACAYAFCGGVDKYDETLYNLGKKAFMEAYDNDETWEKISGAKPQKTARGSSKKTTSKKSSNPKTLEDRVSSLEEKLDLILAKLG
jgi:hypothetical protein